MRSLIEKYSKHLSPALREQVDADLLVTALGQGTEAQWPRLEPIVKTCLESDDPKIGQRLMDAYMKANAGLGRKMAALLAPRWRDVATAPSTGPEKAAAFRKFLNMDGKEPSVAAAYRLLLSPIGDADEAVSLDVLKVLLGDSKALKAEETEVLIEALSDGQRRTNVRCFAVDHLGEGRHAARAIPALVGVLREKADAKLLSLSIKALVRIGDKGQDVLNALLGLATSAEEATIRLESLQVLKQLEPSALSTARIVERWPAEKSSSVRQALGMLLQSRLALLQPEQMKELLPLLRHTDVDLVVEGLKVVLAKKEAAAEVAAEVANLLKRDEATVRKASCGRSASSGLRHQ